MRVCNGLLFILLFFVAGYAQNFPGCLMCGNNEFPVDEQTEKKATEIASNITDSLGFSIGMIVDKRDGEVYRVLNVDGKSWMIDNLRYKIDNSYCRENKKSICKVEGRLYQMRENTLKALEKLIRKKDRLCNIQSCGEILEKVRTRKEVKKILESEFYDVCPENYTIPTQEDYNELNDKIHNLSKKISERESEIDKCVSMYLAERKQENPTESDVYVDYERISSYQDFPSQAFHQAFRESPEIAKAYASFLNEKHPEIQCYTTLKLKVTVDSTKKISSVVIKSSTGFQELDKLIVDAVRQLHLSFGSVNRKTEQDVLIKLYSHNVNMMLIGIKKQLRLTENLLRHNQYEKELTRTVLNGSENIDFEDYDNPQDAPKQDEFPYYTQLFNDDKFVSSEECCGTSSTYIRCVKK